MNNINSNLNGIYLSARTAGPDSLGSVNNTVTSNTIKQNTGYGIYISSGSLQYSSNNVIYNNFFDNTNNAFSDEDSVNYWNTTRTSGVNIIGGVYMGGNFWNDYTGVDSTGDGIGDTNLPYKSNGTIVSGGDMLPLVEYTNVLSCGSAVINSSVLTGDLTCNNINGLNVIADNVVLDCSGYKISSTSGTDYGINVAGVNNVTIQNCIIENFVTGIFMTEGSNNNLFNNEINDNSAYGILLSYSINADVFSNTLSNNPYGIYLSSVSSSNVLSNTILGSGTGLYLYIGTINNAILSNSISGSSVGIETYTSEVSGNIIYDNIFNNTLNALTFGNNYFNTTLQCNPLYPNILGRDCKGGNYWSDYLGIDKTADAIGDTEIPYTSNNSMSIGDYLPLVYEASKGTILDCGALIKTDIRLGNNLNCSGNAIIIDENAVTFDCQGHTITGYASGNGITLSMKHNVNIKNCTIKNFTSGIYLFGGENNSIFTNYLTENNKSVELYIADQVSIFSNIIKNNNIGISIEDIAGYNLIYNNYFNNTINAYSELDTEFNYWNKTYDCSSGTNIINGTCIGGNFWNDYAGSDTTNDGIGDTEIPYNSNGNIIAGGDYLPLTIPANIPPIVNPGGGGGGGGPTTYTPSETQLLAGWQKMFGGNDRIKFIINTTTYFLNVVKISDNTVRLTITPGSTSFNMNVGDLKKLDLNNDGYYDFLIEVIDISYNRAELFLQKIHEKIYVPAPITPVETEQPAPAEAPAPAQTNRTLIYILAAGIAIIAAAIGATLLARYLYQRSKSRQVREEILAGKAREFIKEAKRNGYTEQAIEKMLREKGWSQEDINGCLKTGARCKFGRK